MKCLRVWINLTGVDLPADHAEVRHVGCDLDRRMDAAQAVLQSRSVASLYKFQTVARRHNMNLFG